MVPLQGSVRLSASLCRPKYLSYDWQYIMVFYRRMLRTLVSFMVRGTLRKIYALVTAELLSVFRTFVQRVYKYITTIRKPFSIKYEDYYAMM